MPQNLVGRQRHFLKGLPLWSINIHMIPYTFQIFIKTKYTTHRALYHGKNPTRGIVSTWEDFIHYFSDQE